MHPGKTALLTRWIAALPISPNLASHIEAGIAGGGWLGLRPQRVAVIILPMLAATFATVSAVGLLVRSEGVPETVVRTIQRIGIVVAIATVPAFPIFTSDFWLSAGWGRMVAQGTNPYGGMPEVAQLTGLPYAYLGTTMTYGPLWAMIAGTVALVSQQVAFVEFVAFKLVLLASWIASLVLIRRIAERRSTRDAAISLSLMAWLPAPLWFTIGEGHNDVVLMMFLVLWLAAVIGSRPLAGPLAIMGATLAKYIAVPLLGVDALYVFLTRRVGWRAYGVALGMAAVACVLVFAPFLNGGEFLAPLTDMRKYVFWTPAAAMTEFTGSLGRYVGLPVTSPLVTMGLIVVLFFQLRSMWHRPSPDTLIRVALAVICLETFVVVGHVWPWFLLWGLPFAVLAWRHWLGQAFLSVVLLSPLLNVAWIVAPDFRYRGLLGILLYGGAALLMLALTWSPIGRRIRSDPAPEWNTLQRPFSP